MNKECNIKSLHIALASFVLAGCASSGSIPHTNSKLPDAEVAIFKPSTELKDYLVTFEGYSNAPYDTPTYRFESRNEVRIPPGRYLVRIGCSNAKGYASPRVEVLARAGITYEIGCNEVGIPEKHVRARISYTYVTGSR